MKSRLAPRDQQACATESMLLLSHYWQSLDYQGKFWKVPDIYLYLHIDAALHDDGIYLLNGQRLGESNLRAAALHLARALRYAQSYEKSEMLLFKMLKADEIQFGTGSPQAWLTKARLADIYSASRQHEKAERHWKVVQKDIPSPVNPEDCAASNIIVNLGICYEGQKKYAEAEPLLQQAIRGIEQTKILEYYVLMIATSALVGCYMKQNNFEEADQPLSKICPGMVDQLSKISVKVYKWSDWIANELILTWCHFKSGQNAPAEWEDRETFRRWVWTSWDWINIDDIGLY